MIAKRITAAEYIIVYPSFDSQFGGLRNRRLRSCLRRQHVKELQRFAAVFNTFTAQQEAYSAPPDS